MNVSGEYSQRCFRLAHALLHTESTPTSDARANCVAAGLRERHLFSTNRAMSLLARRYRGKVPWGIVIA